MTVLLIVRHFRLHVHWPRLPEEWEQRQG